MTTQLPGAEIAGYRIESLIGRGGMAVVYRAEDLRLGRKVALKLLSAQLADNDQFRQRFIRESRLAASLDHPNIVPIYEAGEAEGQLFIAMRYVVGSDLKGVLADAGGRLPVDRTLQFFAQIGDALDTAHRAGLVHRDVKPGNILVAARERSQRTQRTRSALGDHVYLTDFGLTKRTAELSGGLTATGHFLGTVDYVSPEQIQGKPVGPGTDIYALGCVLYECLTGQLPFRRDDDAAMLWAHLVETPPPVTGIRPELPPAVNAVVARAMAKDPADRYQSAEELLQELEPALGLPAPVPPWRSRPTGHSGDATGPGVASRGTDAGARTVGDDRSAVSVPTAAWLPPPGDDSRASARGGAPSPAGSVAAPVGPDDTAARADAPSGAQVGGPARGEPSSRVPEPRTGEPPGAAPSEVPPSQPPPTATSDEGRARRRRPALLVLGLVLLVLGAGLIGYLALRPDGEPRADPVPTSPPAASAPATPTSVAPAVPIPSIGPTIPVGDTPGFVVAAPSGRQLYVANREAGVVTVVDTAVDRVTATIPISAGPPQFIAFSPDGRKAYVSVWDDARTIATVIVLDTTTNAVAATIPVETRPYLSAVSPDGNRVYVPNHDTGTVSVIDAATDELTTSFEVPANPHWVAFTPDGSTAYTANHESNLVAAIDPASNTVVAEIPVPTSPHSIAVHPTRPLAIVASYDADSASVFDTGTNEVIATIPVGVEPQHAAWSADGRFAYITNNGDDTVSVIDADTLAVTATIPTGPSPTSVAVLPDGSRGYVSELRGGTLTVLNLAG